MGKVVTVQDDFSMGMRRDSARPNVPSRGLWNAVDVLVNYGGPLRQRGPWTNFATIVSASGTKVAGGVYANFSTSAGGDNTKNLAINEDGNLYDITSGTASIGAAVTIIQNPVFHAGTSVSAATAVYTGLVIIPDGTGAAVPKKYDGTTLSNLGGTPPAARYATVYKDYTVLGNGTVSSIYYPSRIWFSPEGDPDCFGTTGATAWNTTDSWIDLSLPVKGFGPTLGSLLVFHDSAVSRIRGSVPPPDTDMTVDHNYFNVGLCDARSIVSHGGYVLWASPDGVFRSDGVVLDDLARRGGMSRYWHDLMLSAESDWTFAGGVVRDHYFLIVMDGSEYEDGFMIDLNTSVWTRITNVDALSMWPGLRNKSDELYFGREGAERVGYLSSVFTPASNSLGIDDPDGDDILPVVETGFYSFDHPGLKRFGRVYVGFELREFTSGNPTCAVAYALTPEEGKTMSAAGTLSEVSKSFDIAQTYDRAKLDINKQGFGIAFRFTRAGVGGFALHNIGVEVNALEQTGVR